MADIAAIAIPVVEGDFVTCLNAQVPGITYDGGYADYMIAPPEALVHIPDELSEATEVGPMMCAGITTYNKRLQFVDVISP